MVVKAIDYYAKWCYSKTVLHRMVAFNKNNTKFKMRLKCDALTGN